MSTHRWQASFDDNLKRDHDELTQNLLQLLSSQEAMAAEVAFLSANMKILMEMLQNVCFHGGLYAALHF
jgi:hypothetical protein